MTWKSETVLVLNESDEVTLDANGEGWIRGIGPIQSYEKWEIYSTTSRVTGNGTRDCELRVYSGQAVVDSTYAANLNTSDSRHTLMPGHKLDYHFSGGTAGARATIDIAGQRIIRGKVSY